MTSVSVSGVSIAEKPSLENTPPSKTKESILHRQGEVVRIISAVPDQSEKGYTLPAFIAEDANGIYINLDMYIDTTSFRTFLDHIFQNGNYFVDTNYHEITKILYDFQKLEQFRKNVKVTEKNPLIKIASKIECFSDIRRSLYHAPKVSVDNKSADYFFSPAYLEKVEADGKFREVATPLNIDEFIATMWQYNLKFGLDIEDIKDKITKNKAERCTITRQQDPTIGKNATMEPVISFEIQRGVKDINASKADILIYKQGYIRVDSDTPIYKKIPAVPGVSGWTIYGDKLLPDESIDLSIDSFLGFGVRKQEINGIWYIVSSNGGFPRIEEDLIAKGRQQIMGLQKIHVDEKITFTDGIGMSTGKVDMANDICSQKIITLDTHGKDVSADSDLEANIHASNDIIINGNIHGNIQSTLPSEHNPQASGDIKGKVISDSGDITVKGHINNSYLEARTGIISLHRATNSIIIGKTVIITGDIFNCMIIADEIILKGRVMGCRIICGRELNMVESSQKGNFENIISIYSRDLRSSIEKKEEILKKEESIVSNMEDTIDQYITESIPNIVKLLSEKTKRMDVIRKLIEMLMTPKIIESEEYKKYIGLLAKFKPYLEKRRQGIDTIYNKKVLIKKLIDDIKSEKEIMDGYQKELILAIKYIRGPTYIQQIKFLSNKKLLTLTKDELNSISDTLAKDHLPGICSLEKIESPQFGQFNWSSK